MLNNNILKSKHPAYPVIGLFILLYTCCVAYSLIATYSTLERVLRAVRLFFKIAMTNHVIVCACVVLLLVLICFASDSFVG